MSRYEWERGEFVLPSAEWAGFKAAIRDAVNRSNAAKYELAAKLHPLVAAEIKGKRKPELLTIANTVLDKLVPEGRYSPVALSPGERYEIVQALVERKYDTQTRVSSTKLKKPQKKDFPQHGNTATKLETIDCSVTFDNSARKALWNVPESNHACDHARESVLGKAFFAALKKVKWTRGTGGDILGNDENNRDSGRGYEGGGGSYSKDRFGPDMPKEAPTPFYGFARGRF